MHLPCTFARGDVLGGGDLGGDGFVAGLGDSSEEDDTSGLGGDFFSALILFFLVGSVVILGSAGSSVISL